jgi:hypothetical protein
MVWVRDCQYKIDYRHTLNSSDEVKLDFAWIYGF